MRSPVDGRAEDLSWDVYRDTIVVTAENALGIPEVWRFDGEKLSVCLLVDSGRLYRFPFEETKGIRSLAIKARYLRGEMEHLRLREFQPGLCRYVERADQAV